MSREPDILAACAGLAEATGAYENSIDASHDAERAVRDAQRRLNRMQYDFDQMYQEMRRVAPRDSFWGNCGTVHLPIPTDEQV